MPTTRLLPEHPPWRRLLIAAIALPLLVVLAVLAFAWPAARIAPRELPVGIVGATPASQAVVTQLGTAEPGAFDFQLFANDQAAIDAIRNRDVYGAFVVTASSVTVLEASAASPVVAQLLTGVGDRIGGAAHVAVRTDDVVPLASDDPRGAVFGSVLLPLSICGVIVAAAIAVLFQFRPAWRQLLALAVISSLAGLGVYLVAQGFLGALPHQPVATWAALALTIFAIAAATAGAVALVGIPGLGVAGLTMVFLGNPFSGANSAPDLLPSAVDHLGQWLPPGAAANLLRSTAYFGGNSSGAHVAVLTAWAVAGIAAIVAGHRRSSRHGATEPIDITTRTRHVAEPESVTG